MCQTVFCITIPPMEYEMTIERLAYGGEGIGRLEGKIFFIEGALPGEKVLARITQDKKKFLRGETVRVINPSPHRVVPPCPYLQECGGCQYQHLEYKEELRWKEIQVREYMERNLKIAPSLISPITPSPSSYHY